MKTRVTVKHKMIKYSNPIQKTIRKGIGKVKNQKNKTKNRIGEVEKSKVAAQNKQTNKEKIQG